jgi:hypothetical protein
VLLALLEVEPEAGLLTGLGLGKQTIEEQLVAVLSQL